MSTELFHQTQTLSDREADRLDAIEQAASRLRHDLNNPLFVICGSAESALKRMQLLEASGVPGLEELRTHIERILAGAERVQQVIEAFSEVIRPMAMPLPPGFTASDYLPSESPTLKSGLLLDTL